MFAHVGESFKTCYVRQKNDPKNMRKFITILVLSVLLFNTQPLITSAHASGTIARIIQNIVKYFKNTFSKGVNEAKTFSDDSLKTLSDDGLKNVMKKDGDEALGSGNKEFLQQGVEKGSSIGGDD